MDRALVTMGDVPECGESAWSNMAIRMAHERIPLAAIGRVLKRPFSDVEMAMERAQARGEIGFMPASDWRGGMTGEAVEAKLVIRKRSELTEDFDARVDALRFAMRSRKVNLTWAEASLLVLIADRGFETHATLHATISPDAMPKIIDVYVCKLRAKIRPLQIRIETVWGSWLSHG